MSLCHGRSKEAYANMAGHFPLGNVSRAQRQAQKGGVEGGTPCSSRRDSGDTLLLSPPYTNTTTITDLLKIPMAESMLRYGAPSHREPTKQGVQSLLRSDSGTLKGHSGKDGGRQLPESRKPQRLPPSLGLEDRGSFREE